MNAIQSKSGRFICVDQDDDNFVVYRLRPDGSLGPPEWDEFSTEATEPPETDGPSREPLRPSPPSPPDVIHPPPGGGGVLRLHRVTSEHEGGLINRGYSYWSQAWVDEFRIWVFAGHVDGRPRLYAVDRRTGNVETSRLWLPYSGTTEGWSWDLVGWIYCCHGPELHRFNPFTAEDRLVFSIAETHPGCQLWQSHSSDDGRTHSATVQRIVSDGPYPKIGTVLVHDRQQVFYPAIGTLDESAITPDGGWLIIKDDEHNYIKPLTGGQPWVIRDNERALGHSDCGDGIMVGEADKPDPGGCVLWDLRNRTMRFLFPTLNMGYVSVRAGIVLHSDATHLNLVSLDGTVTPLLAHGSVGNDYDSRVKANLSPCGRVACWTSNMGTNRMGVFVAELP